VLFDTFKYRLWARARMVVGGKTKSFLFLFRSGGCSYVATIEASEHAKKAAKLRKSQDSGFKRPLETTGAHRK
jgi:hypothetical protein